MRYYDIKIYQGETTTLFREYTSFPQVGSSNQNDPGALNVIFDAYVVPFAVPMANTGVQIWGISLQDIAQASDFTNCRIEVYAGFQAGLPLNNPKQAALLFAGKIWQSFANWQGTDMTLDFVVVNDGALAAQKTNISFDWKAGTPLATAIATTLTTAFPTVKQNIQISPKLILAHDEPGFYLSMPAFAGMLKGISSGLIGNNYAGVDIIVGNNTFTVFDRSTQTTPIAINFQDLIGQPTWILPNTIQIGCPMRADLSVNDYITMPRGLVGAPGAVTTTAPSMPQNRAQSAFTGTFHITQVHHMGNFRQPDGQSWISVINAVGPGGAS